MTPAELGPCLASLHGYYPNHEWGDDVHVVWADALLPMTQEAAFDAIRSMGQTERFPSVAALLEHRAPTQGVVVEADRIFLPGTGWIDKPKGDLKPPPLELEAPTEVIDMAEAKRRIANAARRKNNLPLLEATKGDA